MVENMDRTAWKVVCEKVERTGPWSVLIYGGGLCRRVVWYKLNNFPEEITAPYFNSYNWAVI